MHYYVVYFTATINGSDVVSGIIGSTSPHADYKPNIIKATLTDKYRKEYGNVPVAIVFTKVDEVDVETYKEAAKGFVTL